MKIRKGNYTFSFDFLKNSSLLIDQIVRFIPLSLTVKISKDNPCDTNNIYRANWTKMMKEGRDLLLGTSLPLPLSEDAKEGFSRKMPVGSCVKWCEPVKIDRISHSLPVL